MLNKIKAIEILKHDIYLDKRGLTYCHDAVGIEAHEMAIKALEQEPKIGHWIVHPKGIYAHLVCDKCLSNAPYDCRTNYCPNCGAKMESEDENE